MTELEWDVWLRRFESFREALLEGHAYRDVQLAQQMSAAAIAVGQVHELEPGIVLVMTAAPSRSLARERAIRTVVRQRGWRGGLDVAEVLEAVESGERRWAFRICTRNRFPRFHETDERLLAEAERGGNGG